MIKSQPVTQQRAGVLIRAVVQGRPFRRFHMVRDEDETGVSGTGTVAQGVQFSDGTCTLRWIVEPSPSTAVYDSIEDLERIHGHNGKTRIVFLDEV